MFPLSNYRISLCKVFFRFFAFLLCVNYVTVSLKICLLFRLILSFGVEEVFLAYIFYLCVVLVL